MCMHEGARFIRNDQWGFIIKAKLILIMLMLISVSIKMLRLYLEIVLKKIPLIIHRAGRDVFAYNDGV